jgi:hypothetical protein
MLVALCVGLTLVALMLCALVHSSDVPRSRYSRHGS